MIMIFTLLAGILKGPIFGTLSEKFPVRSLSSGKWDVLGVFLGDESDELGVFTRCLRV
jgi:hypothetical protein